MKSDSDPRLPRSPQDPDNLRRLREKARADRDEEERMSPATIYGMPPPPLEPPAPPEMAPVYGGPPSANGGGSMTRRLTLWGLLLLALGAIGAIIVRLFGGFRIIPLAFGQSGPPAPVYGGPPIPPPQPPQPSPGGEQQILVRAIQTPNGHLLTAVKGGGLGNPKSAPHGVALTTGATTAGPLETFTFVWLNKATNTFALKTRDGHFVTAVEGIGGPDSEQAPIHTTATALDPWAEFTVTLLPDNVHATIRTADGRHFLSAANGGGVGGSSKAAIHTDATQMVPTAVFQLVPAGPLNRPPATIYGGPPIQPVR